MQTSLQLEAAGKLQLAVESAASPAATGNINCRKFRLFIKDRKTGIKFLIDSGADISLIPADTKSKSTCTSYKLYAANGTEIPTFGSKVLTVDLGLRRPFQWPFVVAKVNRGILGADFLNQFHLLLDIRQRKLIDGVTNMFVHSDVMSVTENTAISTVSNSVKFSELLRKYPGITKPNLLNTKVKHKVQHYIATKGQPVYSRARQLDAKTTEFGKTRVSVHVRQWYNQAI
ncbi:uncharacterized protein LOC118185052 [Stegodyphus dumicola]|uniref:uncharacterized protein LOC118185052 n=1 Tax=Stegodyphus dumicola TaxID=202533 RepID=UPI0015AF1E83|nr:uncharacterized protein LOC118185052 [Stegodyphus dumicola]